MTKNEASIKNPTDSAQSRPSSPPVSPAGDTNGAPKRKSWFNHLRNPARSKDPPPSSYQPLGAIVQQEEAGGDKTDRLRPIQFSPNRIATLYVTPSERNLYLAAMAHLSEDPRPLPLWSEPAPTLPQFPISPTIEHGAHSNVQMPNGAVFSPTSPTSPYGASHGDHLPLSSLAMSPKLVTSPNLPLTGSGLQIRDEFRNIGRPQTTATKHALLSLNPPGSLRFTGFPLAALIAIDEVLIENWPLGVLKRSDSVDALKKRLSQDRDAEIIWKVDLEGKAWKRKGSQELDSVRLLLAILTKLGVYGWSVVDSVKAAGVKKDSHNLLMRYSAATEELPPCLFALSFPLPDRISVISAPSKSTPALIAAVRNAISSNPYNTGGHSRMATGDTTMTAGTASSETSKVVWGKGNEIKLEGWVHHGVYRFWVGGMRRWLVGNVKKKVVDNLHPGLLIGIVNNLAALHFSLAASVPLLPVTKGRDILFFSSTPPSGLTHLDTFKPNTSGTNTAGSESPVFVSPGSSPRMTAPPLPPRRDPGQTGFADSSNAQPLSPRPAGTERRILPWTSILSDAPGSDQRAASPAKSSGHKHNLSQGSSTAAPPPSAMPVISTGRLRTSSQDSSRPLIGHGGSSSVQSSPRPRNVLMKKASLRRHRSNSGNNTPTAPASQARDTIEGSDSEKWSMIDVPAHVGKLGIADQRPEQDVATTNQDVFARTVPPTQITNMGGPAPGRRYGNIEAPAAQSRHVVQPLQHGGYGGIEVVEPNVSSSAASAKSVSTDSNEYLPTNSMMDNEAVPPGQLLSLGGPYNPESVIGLQLHTVPPPAQGHISTTAHDGFTTTTSAPISVPVKETSTAPKRTNEAVVDVGGGIGIPIMYGSVHNMGTTRSMMSGISGTTHFPERQGEPAIYGQMQSQGQVPEPGQSGGPPQVPTRPHIPGGWHTSFNNGASAEPMPATVAYGGNTVTSVPDIASASTEAAVLDTNVTDFQALDPSLPVDLPQAEAEEVDAKGKGKEVGSKPAGMLGRILKGPRSPARKVGGGAGKDSHQALREVSSGTSPVNAGSSKTKVIIK